MCAARDISLTRVAGTRSKRARLGAAEASVRMRGTGHAVASLPGTHEEQRLDQVGGEGDVSAVWR